ncbi:type VI secretion system contractile sheath domain-containing protein, partial [Escherichia coli]
NSFTELAVPRDLTKIFESLELIKWRAFRESEDSRYVSLVLPNFLLRLPYGPETRPVNSFTELAVPRDLTKIFESLELIKWRAFRESED